MAVYSNGSSDGNDFSGLEGLLSGARFGQLEVAYVDTDLNIALDPDQAGLIASSPSLDRVTDFGLGAGRISAEAARAITTGRFWPNLQKLYLPFADDSAATAIVTAGLPPLRHLNMNCNRFSSAGIEALVNSPQFGTVEILDLSSGRFGDESVRALVRSPHLGNLRRLDLSGGFLALMGPDGAKALAACPLLTGLVSLEVWHNKIQSAGTMALAESPYLGGLKELIVDKIYGKARKMLKERFGNRVGFL
jgi:hypothetical protein